jgi:CubicO group peptidase (beta-lactamase class C family)
MQVNFRHAFYYALALMIVLPATLTGQSFSKSIDSIIATEKDFSGVILLAKNGRQVYHKAFGFREFASKQALHKSDIFELASISKQFTAFIIIRLQQEGLLKYDDPVEKYLDIPYKGITIRHLLTHTSGLPDYQQIMDQYWDKSKVAGNAEILQYLKQYRPPELFKPGEKYDYSNTGYVLLASIAEKASGRDFIDLCREKIFVPLKMHATGIRSPEIKRATKNFTAGHIYVDSLHRYARADSFPSSDYTIWLGNRKGPGRVSSTAADLLLWDNALNSKSFISPVALADAFKPMRLNDGSTSNYGFGWDIRQDSGYGQIVWHNGSNPGYSTQIIRYLDKKKTLIILSNNAYGNFRALISKLEKALMQD